MGAEFLVGRMACAVDIVVRREGETHVKKFMIMVLIAAVLPLLLFAQQATGQTTLKEINVNGVELHYVDQGTGVPVVFVHGGLEDYRSWDEQVSAFAQRYRAIAYSRRYNYPNAGAAFGKNYSATVDAEDLVALLRKLKLPPAHIVGVSYGAYVALILAAKHSELVRSMVLAEPPLLRWLPAIEGGEPLYAEFMRIVWEPTTRGFRISNEAGVAAAIDGFGELGYSGTDQKMTYATIPPEMRGVLLENAPEWKALTMSRDAFPPVLTDVVRRIKAPTLLLSGQRSLKLAHAIDIRLERLLPHAQRVILPDATHEMWSEYPAECRDASLAFLAKH
jgi:non-heme chloroperoxidase